MNSVTVCKVTQDRQTLRVEYCTISTIENALWHLMRGETNTRADLSKVKSLKVDPYVVRISLLISSTDKPSVFSQIQLLDD
jgi:hypothetical protein